MKRFEGWIGIGYFCIVFGLLFIFFFPFQWVLLQNKKWYPAAHAYRSFWARVLLGCWGVRCRIINKEYLDAPGPMIICSNHASYLDIIVFCAVFRRNTCFMAKTELSRVPLFGIFFRTIDIQVDRGSKTESATAYRKGVRALESGQNLVIYPEGGIFPDPLVLKPLKDGAFQLAIRHKIPILPVGMPDNYKIIPDPVISAKPGKIRVILHEPLQTALLSVGDMDRLKEALHHIIQNDIRS